jgi:YD repeat-containing protein
VAKIENMAYGSIPPDRINAIKNASNALPYVEAALLNALAALQTDAALANAMVTTYTHIPLVGISTITDTKGDKITYYYDSFNRLKEVRDKDNNILSENSYHYRFPN